jgi:hypothetical protein
MGTASAIQHSRKAKTAPGRLDLPLGGDYEQFMTARVA